MTDEPTSLQRLLEHVPRDSRVVAETVATCALAEFEDEWPDGATAMATVVCGRWIRRALAAAGESLNAPDAHYIDRVVNECYCALDTEQVEATEQLFSELYKGG